ncbi:MAG: hypothetical protein PHW02_07600 [bacterium]|nr:hypothetical protein [bacterium]
MLIFQALSLFLSIFAFSDTLEIEEKRDTIYLDRAIYDNSLQIISGTSILKNETDYLFASGRIIFLKNVSFPLTVIYEETAEKIFYIYSKHTEEKSLAVEQVVEEKKSDSSKILIEGYKSFLVTSQGGSSALDQALDVNLKGEISSDWFIDGRIYDNTSDINSATINTPISQLENVYISLYGPKGEATLGSSSFKGFSNEFSSFSREIFGLTAYAKIKDYPVGFAAAGQKGKLSTVSFYCTDKVQGPYKLYESVFISAYSIAPESERIYLDGELLSSGEENDYTINYFTGEITFSPVRIVNERSYVYAEFQTYEELTPVSGYFLKTGQDSSGLSLLYAHEDQSVFDETARNLLYSIPSDSTSFEVSGALYAGYGKGDYILSDSIFVFAGSGNGDYSVEFFYVGYRKGDYVFSPSLSAYVYAGDGMGNYSDSKRISLPFSSDYLSLSYRKEFSFGSLSVQSSNGMYSSNRYSFDKKKSSGLSLGGEYGSKKFFVGKISSDFTIRGFSRSETYREKWGVAEIRDEPLSEILNKRSASKELGFKVNLGYEDLFKTQEYFSFLDSSRDAGFSVSSDTISGFFLSAGKRISHIVDSLVYSSGDLKAGRRFEFFDAYFFLRKKRVGF